MEMVGVESPGVRAKLAPDCVWLVRMPRGAIVVLGYPGFYNLTQCDIQVILFFKAIFLWRCY